MKIYHSYFSEYTKYAKQIREEYKHIPDEQFKKSRIEVCYPKS